MSDERNGVRSPGRRILSEAGGAFGDLGTFVPHVIAAITVAGLSPVGVLFGFGVFLIGSGAFYGLPMAAQPMKAVSAVMVSGRLGPDEIAATGFLIGLVFLALGLTGLIRRLARLIPQSVTAGLQLGLGLSMIAVGLGLMRQTPWLGGLALTTLLILLRFPRVPAAPAALLAATLAGALAGEVTIPQSLDFAWTWPSLKWFSWSAAATAIEAGIVPQLPLTLTNAVIMTAALCRDLFPDAGQRATERRLALSTGLANALLAPLGAMPMCHGAGGVQAQHRFGARTGLAPVLFGSILLVLAFGLAGSAAALFGVIPTGAVGALLLIAGSDLAISRRLFDARPACWPAIGGSAAATLLFDPAIGLAVGAGIELVRASLRRRIGTHETEA